MRTKLLSLAIVLGSFAGAAKAQSHSVTLAWVDTVNPAGTTYNAFRAPGACTGSPTFTQIVAAVAVKTYVDTTVVGGAQYCYEVTAVYMGVMSAPSPTVGATVPVTVVPPTGLTAVAQ